MKGCCNHLVSSTIYRTLQSQEMLHQKNKEGIMPPNNTPSSLDDLFPDILKVRIVTSQNNRPTQVENADMTFCLNSLLGVN